MKPHRATGSARINDLQGLNIACVKHGVMAVVDAVSSLDIENFNIDDYPGVGMWGFCPQKAMLALTYAPASFTD